MLFGVRERRTGARTEALTGATASLALARTPAINPRIRCSPE